LTTSNTLFTTACTNEDNHNAYDQQSTGSVYWSSTTIQPNNGQIEAKPTISATATNACPHDMTSLSVTSATFKNVVLHIQNQQGIGLLTWYYLL